MFSRHFYVFKNCVKCFSTDANILKSKAKNVQIPKISLHEYLWRNLDKWSDKTATVCFETQRSYTYYQLYKKSLSLTKFLKDSLKLKKQETVGVVLPNIPEYPIVLLGAEQAGLRVTPCNPNYTSDEIKKQMLASQSRLVFTTSDLLPVVRRAVTEADILIVEIDTIGGTTGGAISFEEACSGEGCEPVDINHADTLFLPYSSGTTGLPKGVQLSQFNIVANLCQAACPEFSFLRDSCGDYQDVVPGFLPFFHIYGLMMIMLHTLTRGGKLVAMPTYNTNNFIKVLQNFKPTVIYGIPLVVITAINNPNIKTEHFSSVRIFMSGAAPLGETDVERFRSKHSHVNLVQGYGMTETSPLTVIQTPFLEHGIVTGGSGLVVPNTFAKIIPSDGSSLENLGPNQSGELIFKGPQVMQGYYNNPQANSEIFLDDGWLKTGDIAHYDENEHFFITDRLKELIKVKGFQVAPAELEEILRDHPSVEDAAVVGIPHPIMGEAPKAFVVRKAGHAVKPSQLEEFVAAKVTKYKQLLGGVTFIEAIPKTPSGKILRRDLKKL